MKTFSIYRSTPLHGVRSSDHRDSRTGSTILPTSQSSSYHREGSNGGYYGARGGRGGGYGRYGNQEGEMSAARQLRQTIHNSQAYGQSRHRDIPVFAASSAATAGQMQQLQLAPSDRQQFAEPSTVIWSEGGIGEVMSPSVWRHPQLHLYFDESKTELVGEGGWRGLQTELEPGMEMDVTFSISNGLLEQLRALQAESAECVPSNVHVFVRIQKITELRASRSASLRTYEQAVVIAKRSGGAAFLINNSGERTVLHPAFMPSDGVRHAILEKAEGTRVVETSEVDDSPASLCVLGRSLAVRLAPAPCWLPNIYPTDRGVTRWALSAEAYGEEKQGRAVVIKSTCHAVILAPVEGDLVGKKTSLHAPIIQMQGQIKADVQQLGSCWRFRACRELPGRTAVWRAFEISEELETDAPIAEAVIDSVLTGNRLIDLEPEEEHWVDPIAEERRRAGEVKEERRAVVKPPSVLDDLAALQLVFAQQPQPAASAASWSAAGADGGESPLVCLADDVVSPSEDGNDDVLVFAPIDDLLDSETFAADVFRAPTILPDEWLQLGVPPHEAIRTEQEMLMADPPRTTAVEREWGVYATGDERPDMRVKPKMKRKKKRARLDSSVSVGDEDEDEKERKEEKREETRVRVASPALPVAEGGSRLQEEEKGPDSEDTSARRRETKEDCRLKKHLASINVGFTTGADLFDLLQGSGEPADAEEPAASAASMSAAAAAETMGLGSPKPAAAPIPAASAAAAAPPSPLPPVRVVAEEMDMFDLLQGGGESAAPTAASEADAPRRGPADDTRARLLGGLMVKEEEQKPAAAPATAFIRPVAAAASAAAAAVGEGRRGGEAEDRARNDSSPPPQPVVAARAAAAAAVAPSNGHADEPFWTRWADEPRGPRAPRFAVLPLPERTRFEDGWWFRPSRARPPPVESRKEARKKRREAEERWREEQVELATGADAFLRAPADDLRARLLGGLAKGEEKKPVASVEKKIDVVVEKREESGASVASSASLACGSRGPADDMRARLLGAVKKEEKPVVEKREVSGASVASLAYGSRAPADDMRARLLGGVVKKEKKPAAPLAVVTVVGAGERNDDIVVENVLVDLSPAAASPSPPLAAAFAAAAASPAPFLQQSSTMLHDDLQGLF